MVAWWSPSDPIHPEPDASVVEGLTWTSGTSTPSVITSSPSATGVASASVPTKTTSVAAQSAPSTTAADACPAVIRETFGDRSEEACAVAWCESKYNPAAIGDEGRSLGMFQLWTGWAKWYGVQPEQLLDPVVNTAVARAVLEHRGRWGGAGGWSCADLEGIH
jgi:hypothetical protein